MASTLYRCHIQLAITITTSCVMALLCIAGMTGVAAGEAAVETAVEFNRDVRPILSEHCFACHGPDAGAREAELRLDTQDGIEAELDSGDGHAVVAGDAAASQLLLRVTAGPDSDVERMPPEGAPLTHREIDILRRWIANGAVWQTHWSFLSPRRPPLPPTTRHDWAESPIDQFILSRLERERLQPSNEADRVTLIRRLSLDLTALPPSQADIDQFVADRRADAYERLADRFIASPHFGERMAAYWLDLVRYADTVGYHGDQDHNISPYRDYVIRSFNANLQFDQFTREQLAGDLIEGATDWQKVASGYNRLLQTTHEGGAQDGEYLAKYAADRVRTTASVWMGATMGCCECHDHKFDPYTIKDFYRFAAFFADVKEQGAFAAPNSIPTTRAPEMRFYDDGEKLQLQQLRLQLAEIAARQQESDARISQLSTATPTTTATESTPAAIHAEHAELAAKHEELTSRIKKLEAGGRMTMITEAVPPRPVRVLARGDWMDTSGPLVTPAIPEFLSSQNQAVHRNRLDLANWLVTPDHPQTSRVMVNRLWQIFFGTGLSKISDDLGAQGEWPVHPELLDWLACEFVDSGWDVKHIVRMLVTSRTYRQSSLPRVEIAQRDPANRLHARQSRFRLEAEMIRDNYLAASGLLVQTMGGRSVKPYQPAGYYAHLNFPERKYQPDHGMQQYRRAVYTHWQRQFLHPALKAFDAPTREECTAARPRSNTPLAALVLLNDPSVIEAARALAMRAMNQTLGDDAERIRWAFRQVVSRAPNARETEVLLGLLGEQRDHYVSAPEEAEKIVQIGDSAPPANSQATEVAAWMAVTRTLFNLNEAIMRN